MIERSDEKDRTRQDFSLTKRIYSNYVIRSSTISVLRPLSYAATSAIRFMAVQTFYETVRSQASFIASFRIETNFTIVQ